jgi:hypothetical protein
LHGLKVWFTLTGVTTQARVYLAVGVAVVFAALIAWQWPLMVDWFGALFGTNQGV